MVMGFAERSPKLQNRLVEQPHRFLTEGATKK